MSENRVLGIFERKGQKEQRTSEKYTRASQFVTYSFSKNYVGGSDRGELVYATC
jgi:hypothetical protein